jgi:hypothetical protein
VTDAPENSNTMWFCKAKCQPLMKLALTLAQEEVKRIAALEEVCNVT